MEAIQIGAQYRMRNGRITGKLTYSPNAINKWSDGEFAWNDKGHYYGCFGIDERDLQERVIITPYVAPASLKNWVENLNRHDRILCNDAGEAHIIIKFCSAAGLPVPTSSIWGQVLSDEKIVCYNPIYGGFCSLESAKAQGYNIIPASDLLPVQPILPESNKLEPIQRKSSEPYWMVQVVGSGEPKHRHSSQAIAVAEAERLLKVLPEGYTKAIVTKHNATVKVATVQMVTRPETKYTEAADYAPDDDLPF